MPAAVAFFAALRLGAGAVEETLVRLGADVAACTRGAAGGGGDFEDSESRGDVLEDTNYLSSVESGARQGPLTSR